jgi:hypothetical protein
MNRWAKRGGVRASIYGAERCAADRAGYCWGESTSRWDGGVKKNGRQSIGKSRGGWTTKKPLMVKSTEEPIVFSLSAGNRDDATEGRWVLESIEPIERRAALLMDQAYADSQDPTTRFV